MKVIIEGVVSSNPACATLHTCMSLGSCYSPIPPTCPTKCSKCSNYPCPPVAEPY